MQLASTLAKAINDILDRLEHSKVAGRVVLDFIGAKADNKTAKAPAAKKMEAAAVAHCDPAM